MIKAENLCKSYPARRDRPGFKEFIVNAHKFLRSKGDSFEALKDVSFTVNKGECLGVIGRNGAGKSTLLSLLLGVSRPTSGRVEITGRLTPLLELGAGFVFDMTGLENIIINGVMLGHTEKEMRDKMDDIIAFSELDDFISMPIRTYSSGMIMRLAFSVAIHTDPEVLLIDEILAVGDESFQKKSSKVMTDLIKGGVTTVFVSHSMDAIKRICDRVIWLDGGRIRAEGTTQDVVDEYIRSMS